MAGEDRADRDRITRRAALFLAMLDVVPTELRAGDPDRVAELRRQIDDLRRPTEPHGEQEQKAGP